jgi:hypothetical protein
MGWSHALVLGTLVALGAGAGAEGKHVGCYYGVWAYTR